MSLYKNNQKLNQLTVKSFGFLQRFKHAIIAITLCTLAGCALNGNPEKGTKTNTQQQNEMKDIGQNMLDLGDIPKEDAVIKTTPTNTLDETKNSDVISQYKAFLAQQKTFNNTLPELDKKQYQTALTHMKNKEWQTALNVFEQLIVQQPNFDFAYINKALAHHHLAQDEAAIKCIQLLEKTRNNNPYLYNVKGVLQRKQGKFKEAEQAYLQALTIWPEFADAHLNTAVFYELYRGDFDQAKKHYQQYLALKPNDNQAKQWLAGLDNKIATNKRN